MQRTFTIRLYTGFLLAILLCATSGLTSYLILQKQENQRVWVRQARQILDTTNSIQNLVGKMAVSRTGFRATNQQQFLDEYYGEVAQLTRDLRQLKVLLMNDPEVQNKEQLLEQQIGLLVAFWKKNGDDAGGYTRETIARLADDEKRQMDRVAGIISDLQKGETSLLNKRREEYNQLISDVNVSTIIDSILSEIIVVTLIYIIVREFRSRRKVQEQLHASVEQLKNKTEILEQSETELKKTMNELETINKALEKFSYTVAHDIKSPLSGIVGALSIMQSDKAINENLKLKQFADLCSDTARHLSEMVNFLLEYSKRNITKEIIEPVDTGELVAQLVQLLFPGSSIEVRIADDMPVLHTRRLRIMQVFQNLISNAIKYNDKKNGLIEIGYNDKGDYYEFYVRDNGQGISQEYKDQIFKLTRVTNNKSARETSTGYGLNITKLVVEEQGGKIRYESTVGQGSVFYFDWKK